MTSGPLRRFSWPKPSLDGGILHSLGRLAHILDHLERLRLNHLERLRLDHLERLRLDHLERLRLDLDDLWRDHLCFSITFLLILCTSGSICFFLSILKR